MNQRGSVFVFGIFILGCLLIAIFIGLRLYHGSINSVNSSSSKATSSKEDIDDKNEDQLSQYSIPNDVIQSLNEAEQSDNPVLGIRTDGPQYHIPILMYHYVEHVKDPKDTIRISLDILPETLESQIQTLLQAHYTFITASDSANILDGIENTPNKPVMLTFDDGYRDFYTDAFPILKKYHVKAVAYIISGFINQPNNLTDAQLQEIAQSGLVEIGAHTVDHLALAGLPSDKARFEIDNSKIQLEQKLGIPVTAFAYPYGSFNIQTIQLVKEAGFRTAVSTLRGSQISNSVRYFAYRLRPGMLTGQPLLNLLK